MTTELCLIYIKDISNPNLFSKQHTLLNYRQLCVSCQNNWVVKEKKIHLPNQRHIWEFQDEIGVFFFCKIKKHEKHILIFIYLITYYFWNKKKKKMHFSLLDFTYNLDYDSKIQKLSPFRGIQWWVFSPHRTLKSHSGKPFCLYSAWHLCRLWVPI